MQLLTIWSNLKVHGEFLHNMTTFNKMTRISHKPMPPCKSNKKHPQQYILLKMLLYLQNETQNHHIWSVESLHFATYMVLRDNGQRSHKGRGENNMLTGWASKLFCPPSKLLPKRFWARKNIYIWRIPDYQRNCVWIFTYIIYVISLFPKVYI